MNSGSSIESAIAISIHPGYAEARCGGLLARLARGGTDVRILTLSGGPWAAAPQRVDWVSDCALSAQMLGAQSETVVLSSYVPRHQGHS